MAKIVQFHEKGGPEVLKLEEVTLLPVAENDVRFRVHAIGLNRAESMYRKGAFLQDYSWPSRVGYEASGVVEAIGKNVMGFAPGGPFRTDFLDDSSLRRTKTVIADYSATAGAAREWADNSHNAQPGDPAKAAAAMVKITEVERPPLRLQLGRDCVASVEAKLEHVKRELEQWRQLAESTAFTE